MSKDRLKIFCLAISAIVILALAILAYFAYPFYKGKLDLKRPEGTLFLTLTPRIENPTTAVYLYDLKDKTFKFVNDKNSVNLNGQGLPNGLAVTSSNFFNAKGLEDENIFQLYLVDTRNNFSKKQITNSRTFLKRHPELSPDGKQVAFMAKPGLSVNATSTDPDDWSVYVTDLEGREKRLGSGAYPQWSPDSKKLIFLRSDGLHLYDLEKRTEAKVWGMTNGPAVLRMGIDVSRDGSLLAWSAPKDHKVFLAKISSWDQFQIEIYKTIDNIFAFWPIFSPDSRYLAMIIGDENGKSVLNPYAAICHIEDLKVQKVLDLSDYFTSSMTLTDWGLLK